MKTLYLANQAEPLEHYETVEKAILFAIETWHEESPTTYAFVVRDEDNEIAATIAPVGSDRAVVVYRHGQVDEYSGITYDKPKAVTRFFYNGSATPTELPWI